VPAGGELAGRLGQRRLPEDSQVNRRVFLRLAALLPFLPSVARAQESSWAPSAEPPESPLPDVAAYRATLKEKMRRDPVYLQIATRELIRALDHNDHGAGRHLWAANGGTMHPEIVTLVSDGETWWQI
jgi:hypothetical protein